MVPLTVRQLRTIRDSPTWLERQEYARQYGQDNRARLNRYRNQYRLDNIDREREKERAWRQRNPDHFRWHKAARRAGAGPIEREYIRVLLGDPCSYCGAPCESIDHIVPVAASGSGDWANLTAACKRCNSIKGAQPVLLFIHNHVHIGVR